MKAEITSFSSSFFEYLCSFVWFEQDRLEALMKRYPIGATEQGEPIFWHINSEHKITNGHIITIPQFGIRKSSKSLVIWDYFCIFVSDYQLLIKNKQEQCP